MNLKEFACAGIQYQSYDKHSIVAQSEHIRVSSGLGHTGSEPFDDQHGWYRSYRGLAGALTYRARRKAWDVSCHATFPSPLRQAVVTMLLCHQRNNNNNNNGNNNNSSSRTIQYPPNASSSASAYAAGTWNPASSSSMEQPSHSPPVSSPSSSGSNKIRRLSGSFFGRSRSRSSSNSSSGGGGGNNDDTGGGTMMVDEKETTGSASPIARPRTGSSSSSVSCAENVSHLSRLPLHTIYYIMEFMVKYICVFHEYSSVPCM